MQICLSTCGFYCSSGDHPGTFWVLLRNLKKLKGCHPGRLPLHILPLGVIKYSEAAVSSVLIIPISWLYSMLTHKSRVTFMTYKVKNIKDFTGCYIFRTINCLMHLFSPVIGKVRSCVSMKNPRCVWLQITQKLYIDTTFFFSQILLAKSYIYHL